MLDAARGSRLEAEQAEDVGRLHGALVQHFSRHLVESELRVPYDRQQLRGEIYEHMQVIEERYDDDAVVFRVRADPAQLARLTRTL